VLQTPSAKQPVKARSRIRQYQPLSGRIRMQCALEVGGNEEKTDVQTGIWTDKQTKNRFSRGTHRGEDTRQNNLRREPLRPLFTYAIPSPPHTHTQHTHHNRSPPAPQKRPTKTTSRPCAVASPLPAAHAGRLQDTRHWATPYRSGTVSRTSSGFATTSMCPAGPSNSPAASPPPS